ncbi:hypothetical protein BHECKSOX_1138 [Bathymodiolus heckerae thiotrophic gill symbiont]|uniref:tetratricopeptide repeat protein n=1 Tax=Bathymodiolus heckerae thiotrophic gill symbiont TaxID=1052212 RepID=UPI0010B9BE7B|nr:SEL1-like repeat protein [Bathymodiolus heckerae thiotrophic gill symbiont]SHN92605.1 hypothetical protein BHECKSOX_1138 [Bathymodiolus heckerae thiotrophic gill symbiont]
MGVERDIELLSEWRKISIEPAVNNANYQYWIAKKYLHGEGVEKNSTTGMEWMVCAAFQGHIEANQWIENAYLYLAFPSCAIKKENAEQCYKIAFDYCTKNLNGHKRVETYLFLGVLYSSGKGVVQNDKLAFECFYKAAHICENYGEDADDNWEIDYFVALFYRIAMFKAKAQKGIWAKPVIVNSTVLMRLVMFL